MRRRQFLGALAGIACAPVAVHAQSPRRVAVLMVYREQDAEGQLRAKVFQEGLERQGWVLGKNLQLVFHWGVGDIEWIRSAAAEILKETPDVILANAEAAARAFQSATRTIPIVFIGASDPVAQGFVSSIAHPGGNMTGFSVLEATVGPKWLELLKATAPMVKRVGVIFNPENSGSVMMTDATVSAGTALKLGVTALPIHEATDITAAISDLGREPGGGLVVPPDPFMAGQRSLITELAAHYRLPAIYGLRLYVANGGLISYGISIPDLFRQAALYVDRILRGERPADLPVVLPTKFEFVLNLQTAKALGLDVPSTLLATVDEVIE